MNAWLEQQIDHYRMKKQAFRFLDANCWLDPTGADQLQPVTDLQETLRQLGNHHIHGALITNATSLAYHADTGNSQLPAILADHPSLYGAIVWVPELATTAADTALYLERMAMQRAIAVRMFPKRLRYSLNKWQAGDALAAMEERGMPLVLWHMETSWDAIHEICMAYPRLPVIVEGNDQKLLYHNRFYIKLLEACPNLYLETHNLIQHGELEYIVNQCGIDRLVFGSYFPYNDPNSAMMMIARADIPEASKRLIAGDHMRAIIGNVFQ